MPYANIRIFLIEETVKRHDEMRYQDMRNWDE